MRFPKYFLDPESRMIYEIDLSSSKNDKGSYVWLIYKKKGHIRDFNVDLDELIDV